MTHSKWGKNASISMAIMEYGIKRFRSGHIGVEILKESACNCRIPWFDSWVRKVLWRRDRPSTPAFLGFPGGSAGKESACNVGDLGLIPGLGRSPGERKVYPLQDCGLENSGMKRVGHNWTTFTFLAKGVQNMPCQNMSFWHRGYFEPKAIER